MKEQEDIKQDFDRWLVNQWVEEEYVPSPMDRNSVLGNISKNRASKIRTRIMLLAIGLSFLCALLFWKVSRKDIQKKNKLIPEKEHVVQQKLDAQELVPAGFPIIISSSSVMDYLFPTYPSVDMYTGMLEIPKEDIFVLEEHPSPKVLIQSVDLDTVMKNLGIFFLQSSTSYQGRNFSGVTSGHELVVASVINGSMSYPNTPDTSSSNGGFRPQGMASNQYVQYSFYDVRQLLFNEAIYRQVLAVNVLPRIAYYMRTSAPGWNNPVGMQMRQEVPQPISNATRNQDENMRRIARQAEPNNPYSSYKAGRPFYLRQPIRVNNMAKVGLLIGDNFLIKSQGEKVLVVSCDAERVSLVKEDGVIEASHSIHIEHPRFFSQKAKYPFYDEESQRLFLIVETNFVYMWFEVNQMTGETRYIFKTETIWNDPNWDIKDETLSYTYKGKSYQRRLD
jgi:hypothetical protein